MMRRHDHPKDRTPRRQALRARQQPAPAAHALQAVAGNRATAMALQAKLKVGSVADPAEREADQVAAQLVRALGATGASPSSAEHSGSSGSSGSRSVQRRAEASPVGPDGGPVDDDTARRIQSSSGSGSPLPDEVRGRMEDVLGVDLSPVRVHTGPEAGDLADRLGARAFTHGSDIFFGQGEHRSGGSGLHTLAHEVAHTVQQGAVDQAPVRRLMKAKDFAKKSKLTLRKGKSAATMAAIKADLGSYHSLPPDATADRLALLDNLLERVKLWLADRGSSGKSSRVDIMEKLRDDLEAEIRLLEASLDETPDFTGGNLATTGGTDKGQMNEVKKVTADVGVRKVDGTDKVVPQGRFEGFFKADVEVDKMHGQHRGSWAGIPKDDPNFGARNLATYKLDQLFGANVIPPTFKARLGEQEGIVMEAVQGVSGKDAKKDEPATLDDPKVKSGLAKLYLLDIIAGQVDRHPGNYLVEKKNGVIVGVKGIDNDLAFGQDYTDVDYGEKNKRFNPMTWSILGQSASQIDLTAVPREFLDRIQEVAAHPDLVRDALEGLLSPNEIEATITRLESLARFLQQAFANGDQPAKVTA